MGYMDSYHPGACGHPVRDGASFCAVCGQPERAQDPAGDYQAASGPDDNATADKQAFAAAWNPLAERYGLTQYQWNDL